MSHPQTTPPQDVSFRFQFPDYVQACSLNKLSLAVARLVEPQTACHATLDEDAVQSVQEIQERKYRRREELLIADLPRAFALSTLTQSACACPLYQ